jgi:hypothetical protein
MNTNARSRAYFRGLLGLGIVLSTRQAFGETPDATAAATAVLNTYSKVWVSGEGKGPEKLGKNTGAGTMDAAFAWDRSGYAVDPTKVNLLTVYTRSDDEPNAAGSHMQGGFAIATLTQQGVVPGPEVTLPVLDGERAFMRPLAGFLPGGRALLMAASEDNGVNNNPQPVAYVVSTDSGKILEIPNTTRDEGADKPTNLIQTAVAQGIAVANPGNQRGPHTIQQVSADTFVVGMQFNNQAQEAYSVTVNADNSITMNWLVRYSNNAQHCRPSVAVAPNATTGFIAAVEANNQPADIGIRVTEFDVATGKALQSKIVVRSEPAQKKYVSEPALSLVGDKLAVTYGLSSPARNARNGNGHAGGSTVDAALLLAKGDLSAASPTALGVGQYSRHGSSFATAYGPTATPALAVISGSSTGTNGGFIQMYPLTAEGLLGVKDTAKVYPVSTFSDVANLPARGKRNPNNQARGFINGTGYVPNPGYTTDPEKARQSFMPEVKQLSASTVTGYGGADALAKGLKNSVWLSLVPAVWQEGLPTTPGVPTDRPGTNADGTGPAPRSMAAPTDPTAAGKSQAVGASAGEDGASAQGKRMSSSAAGGCALVTPRATSDLSLVIGVALIGALFVLRRGRRCAGPTLAAMMAGGGLLGCLGGGTSDRLTNGETDSRAALQTKGAKTSSAPSSNVATPRRPSAESDESGPAATTDGDGKTFFEAKVYPSLATSCGHCHAGAGPGPSWLGKDAEASYLLLFTAGYVVPRSRIIEKPVHGGATANVLGDAEKAQYDAWVLMELKARGANAPPNVLDKLGSCFDRRLFDAMDLGAWRTTQRTANNNTNDVTPWNENANNCTGCNKASCSTCHSADAATNFIDAVGNPILPADTTFESSKLTTPAYITKYFAVSPDGKAIASEAIRKKSDATKKDHAYSHPMFELTTEQQAALDAFVSDVTTRFNAGLCGQ